MKDNIAGDKKFGIFMLVFVIVSAIIIIAAWICGDNHRKQKSQQIYEKIDNVVFIQKNTRTLFILSKNGNELVPYEMFCSELYDNGCQTNYFLDVKENEPNYIYVQGNNADRDMLFKRPDRVMVHLKSLDVLKSNN